MASRHVEIAAEQGAKAGFNAWVEQMERSGLPAVQERLAEVRAQGNKKAQFDFYCAQFGKQIDKVRTGNGGNTPTPAPAVGTDVQELQAQLASLLQKVSALTETGVQVEADDDEDDIPDDVDFSSGKTTRTTTTRKATTATPKADPYTPRNPHEAATSGKLWRLNQAGLLKIVQTPGKPITNGQAHDTIRDTGIGR